MFITIDTLRRLKACDQGIKYFERFYPNGAEMIDVIRDRHINKEFLHWGREFLTTNEEEIEAYCVACDIINSEGFWYSQNIHDSKYVVKSKKVNNSISVFESEEVNNSKDIVGSENIDDCAQVFYSSMVDGSQKILKSTNVTESVNICNSTMVACSVNVIDSFNVFDSSEIINCVSVSDSHFCQDCKNIKFCIFCSGLTDAEYCIFNTPVEKSHYEMFVKQYKKYLTEHLDFVREWPQDMLVSTYIAPTRKFDDWYHPISPKFWKWARTLPGFDNMMLYNITMLPELLID